MSEITTRTAGIDTSKATLDVAIHGMNERLQFDNASPGWRRLAASLAKACVTRVGIEATGGYERGVVSHLRAAGFTVLVLQPLQVRAYARLHLRRAKPCRALMGATLAHTALKAFKPEFNLTRHE